MAAQGRTEGQGDGPEGTERQRGSLGNVIPERLGCCVMTVLYNLNHFLKDLLSGFFSLVGQYSGERKEEGKKRERKRKTSNSTQPDSQGKRGQRSTGYAPETPRTLWVLRHPPGGTFTHLERRADLHQLAPLHRVDLAHQVAGDARVLVHDAQHAPPHLNQGDDAGRRVPRRSCDTSRREQSIAETGREGPKSHTRRVKNVSSPIPALRRQLSTPERLQTPVKPCVLNITVPWNGGTMYKHCCNFYMAKPKCIKIPFNKI